MSGRRLSPSQLKTFHIPRNHDRGGPTPMDFTQTIVAIDSAIRDLDAALASLKKVLVRGGVMPMAGGSAEVDTLIETVHNTEAVIDSAIAFIAGVVPLL